MMINVQNSLTILSSNMVKFFAVFILITLSQVTSRPLPPTNNRQVSLKCIEQLQLTNQEVKEIAEKMSYAKVPEEGERFLEFLGCFWIGKGFMNEHGEILSDNLRNCLAGSFQYDQELTSSSNSLAQIVVANCKGITGDDNGLKAAKIQNCITDYLVDMKSGDGDSNITM